MIKLFMQLLLCLACLLSFAAMLATTFGTASNGIEYLLKRSNIIGIAGTVLFPYLFVLATYLLIAPQLARWRSCLGLLLGLVTVPLILVLAINLKASTLYPANFCLGLLVVLWGQI